MQPQGNLPRPCIWQQTVERGRGKSEQGTTHTPELGDTLLSTLLGAARESRRVTVPDSSTCTTTTPKAACFASTAPQLSRNNHTFQGEARRVRAQGKMPRLCSAQPRALPGARLGGKETKEPQGSSASPDPLLPSTATTTSVAGSHSAENFIACRIIASAGLPQANRGKQNPAVAVRGHPKLYGKRSESFP